MHPELSSPLREGEASHHALYAGLVTLGQVLRAACHPASWAEQPGNVWDSLAASAGIWCVTACVGMLHVGGACAATGHAGRAAPAVGARAAAWEMPVCRRGVDPPSP